MFPIWEYCSRRKGVCQPPLLGADWVKKGYGIMPKDDKRHPWPFKGQDIFAVKSVAIDSPTLVALQWLSDLHVTDSWLADAFKTSADRLIDDLKRRKGPEHADVYFFPIGCLYRHALELKLKQVVRLALKLELIEDKHRVQKILSEHQLYPLWNHAKGSIKRFWPDGPEDELSAAERIVQAVHMIDGAGESLRYTKNKRGKSTLVKMPKYVDLLQFRKIYSGVFNMLGGCEDTFEHEYHARCEADQG